MSGLNRQQVGQLAGPRLFFLLELALFLTVQLIAWVALLFVWAPANGAFAGAQTYAASFLVAFGASLLAASIASTFSSSVSRGGETQAPSARPLTRVPRGTGESAKASAAGAVGDLLKVARVGRGDLLGQLRDAAILLFVVFLPLDLALYLFPGFLDYSVEALANSSTGTYLQLTSFSTFLLASFLTHSFVALQEEWTFRAFAFRRGAWHAGVPSALVVTALFFGGGHFNYYFAHPDAGLVAPLTWGASAFAVGLVLCQYVATKGHLLPVVVAHAANNVVSTVTLWNHMNAGGILPVVYWVYLPGFVVGGLLCVAFRAKVRVGLGALAGNLKQFFRQHPFALVLDLAVAAAAWLLSALI
ncbi:MAG: hypothetical protein Kow0069_31710 [Promethearchaeota archaeon]